MKHGILIIALVAGMMASCGNAQKENVMNENVALENLKTRRAIRAYQDKMPDMKSGDGGRDVCADRDGEAVADYCGCDGQGDARPLVAAECRRDGRGE